MGSVHPEFMRRFGNYHHIGKQLNFVRLSISEYKILMINKLENKKTKVPIITEALSEALDLVSRLNI
tara:strand:- start:299 stop:499 length:201 start_codon:yes stop_codon:yes gene_type:complete